MKKSIAIMIFCVILPMCTKECRSMIPEREELDLITPIGTFIDWGCDRNRLGESTCVAEALAHLAILFKFQRHEGRDCIDGSRVEEYMHPIFLEYFKYFLPDVCYGRGCDYEAYGILSLYPAFAEAFGNTDDPSEFGCYCVAAKEDGEDSSCRRKKDMLNGIGEDFSLNCDGGVKNTRKTNACLQLLLLTELAEKGTANDHGLDRNCRNALGYDRVILSKFYKLMSVIME